MFDYTLDLANIDFRRHPELYRIGKGEQGVLLVEPYKGEILPHWRFKTVAEAKQSSAEIFKMFLAYLRPSNFTLIRGSDRRSQATAEPSMVRIALFSSPGGAMLRVIEQS